MQKETNRHTALNGYQSEEENNLIHTGLAYSAPTALLVDEEEDDLDDEDLDEEDLDTGNEIEPLTDADPDDLEEDPDLGEEEEEDEDDF